MKIKKGDKVLVRKGKDRGKISIVEKAFPKTSRLIVEKINVVKKHVKPSESNKRGGIVEINAAFSASNVMIICPSCGKPTRVIIKKSGKVKERICKKCNKSLDKKEEKK